MMNKRSMLLSGDDCYFRRKLGVAVLFVRLRS